MKAELVENLPEGVDGLRVFKIPLKSCEEEGILSETVESGKKTAQLNGKGIIVFDMPIVKDLADAIMHIVLSS